MSQQRSSMRDAVKELRPLRGVDDAELVRLVRQAAPQSERELVRRYGPHVTAVISAILGVNSDLPDVVQDAFLIVFRDLSQLRDPTALRGWLTTVAVGRARNAIRSRRRKWWLRFLPPEDVPEVPFDPETGKATRGVYEALATLPDDERIMLALRFISGCELSEVAEAMDVSLATIKRRLNVARAHFFDAARGDPRLASWLEGGGENVD